MIKLFVTGCEKFREHGTGVSLALYAVRETFGVGVKIAYTERGKPYADRNGIYLSISHSGGLCAAAVSDNEIGADIELINPARDSGNLLRIVNRFFSDDEREYVLADLSARFWEIWTAKESYIKFTGEGLSRSLRSFSTFDKSVNYNKFVYMNYAGCICSPEKADISPIAVGSDKIITL